MLSALRGADPQGGPVRGRPGNPDFAPTRLAGRGLPAARSRRGRSGARACQVADRCVRCESGCQVRVGRTLLAKRRGPSACVWRQGLDVFGCSASCSGCSVRIGRARLARHRVPSPRTVDRRGKDPAGPSSKPRAGAGDRPAGLSLPENPRLLLPHPALDGVPNGMARGRGNRKGQEVAEGGGAAR